MTGVDQVQLRLIAECAMSARVVHNLKHCGPQNQPTIMSHTISVYPMSQNYVCWPSSPRRHWQYCARRRITVHEPLQQLVQIPPTLKPTSLVSDLPNIDNLRNPIPLSHPRQNRDLVLSFLINFRTHDDANLGITYRIPPAGN